MIVFRQAPSATRSLAALFSAACCLALVAGCGSGEPFSYVKVSGKVAYEDGSLLPVDALVVFFHPQCGPIDPKTNPKMGMAVVDPKTGEFRNVTSHKFNDGLIRGKHKVTLGKGIQQPLPPNVAPPEYCDPAQTPLEVDTASLPFVIKVRKPH
jgi:hypothetical protein